MITLQELCDYNDEFLNVKSERDFCPNGLQVEGKDQIASIATAVSASIEAIEQAVDLGADALFVHHGIFWKNQEPTITKARKKKLELLIKSNISLFAYHLPLDAHHELGNNWLAAKELGLSNLKEFSDIGVKGEIEKTSPEAFQKKLEAFYGQTAAHAPAPTTEIKSVALIAGGAHGDLSKAIAANIDCFITGSFDEPMWYMAQESKTHFFAMGHSATEKIGIKALGEHLKEKFGLKATFIDNNNPF